MSAGSSRNQRNTGGHRPPLQSGGSLETGTAITHLECSRTGEKFEAGKMHNLSTAGWPLLVRYDLQKLARRCDRESIAGSPRTIGRYAPLLPVWYRENVVPFKAG